MFEFLLNPNIAYLLLVLGFMLAILALLSPGTGLLEVGALFAFLFSAWTIYHLPINLWALAILAAGVFPFLIAVRKTRALVYLNLAILSLVIGSAFLFRTEHWWQPAVHPLLALSVSVLVGGSLWLVTRKVIEAEFSPPAHDPNLLIGAEGEAKSDIHHEGSVQVSGELWTAHSSEPIPAGASVRVVGRDGFILQVEQIQTGETETS